MSQSLRLIFLASLFLVLDGCVGPFEPELSLDADLLIVESMLTDLPETQFVKISRSRAVYGTSATTPIGKARVEVLINETTRLPLRESKPGYYELPEGFRGRVGERYQLQFQTAEGVRYQSTVETMPAVPPIEKLYDTFDDQGIVNPERTKITPANLIYLDTQDPDDVRNFYSWTWTLWERQAWCASCTQGLYYLNSDARSGICVFTRSLPTNNVYDYGCFGACWEILRSSETNLFADIYTNGRPLTGRVVARIPFYQAVPALVEIRQSSLTPDAYRYFKLLENQTQNTGSLADTPPSPLVGNVRNLGDEHENVVGYFTASATASVRYWLARQNTTGNLIGFFQALNNRPINPEPPSAPPPRPPSAACVLSETRTPIKPEGWRQ